MSKQTAVEWLAEKLKSQGLLIGEPNNLIALKQAKEMEREQIIDAYDAGLFDGTMDEVKDRIHNNYYNETYKGGEQ